MYVSKNNNDADNKVVIIEILIMGMVGIQPS